MWGSHQSNNCSCFFTSWGTPKPYFLMHFGTLQASVSMIFLCPTILFCVVEHAFGCNLGASPNFKSQIASETQHFTNVWQTDQELQKVRQINVL